MKEVVLDSPVLINPLVLFVMSRNTLLTPRLMSTVPSLATVSVPLPSHPTYRLAKLIQCDPAPVTAVTPVE